MAITSGQMTAEELLALPDDGMRHELVAGELRTMPLRGWVDARLAARLGVVRHWSVAVRSLFADSRENSSDGVIHYAACRDRS